jgi:predicted amidohydrolase/GNAT superfamily N-acetyltransferase
MSKLNLKQYEKKLVIRPLEIRDWEQMCELSKKCFPEIEPYEKKQFESQVAIFPDGQVGVEYQGKLVASSSSLILDFELYREGHSWEEISDNGFIRNHNSNGTTLYGIEMMVDPEHQGLKLARRLYDARKKLTREKNLMRIVLGGRIPGYSEHAKKYTPREYIEKVMDKAVVDPVLTTQLANGFVLKRIISDYLKSDKASMGFAAFLEWTNIDYIPNQKQRFIPVSPVRVCVVQFQMRTIESFDDFAKQCEHFIDVASDYKCDFILFPEIFTMQLLSLIKAKTDAEAMRKLAEYTPQYIKLFNRFAVKYNVNIIGGSQFTLENDELYNVSYLFRRDGTLGKQYKLHITPSERTWWGVKGGKHLEVFDTDKGKIAIQICYDIEFPELSRIAADRGAQIIFVPFCTDERYAYLRVRYCAQARCVENHVYVAISGSVGNQPTVKSSVIHYAQSAIFTPSDIPFSRDAIAGESAPNIEGLVFEDLDLELLKQHKQSGSVLNSKDRRHDLYELKYSLGSSGET